jgi:hypothetical protein
MGALRPRGTASQPGFNFFPKPFRLVNELVQLLERSVNCGVRHGVAKEQTTRPGVPLTNPCTTHEYDVLTSRSSGWRCVSRHRFGSSLRHECVGGDTVDGGPAFAVIDASGTVPCSQAPRATFSRSKTSTSFCHNYSQPISKRFLIFMFVDIFNLQRVQKLGPQR